MNKQRGIGLVEILIAMTIGLVLILGLTLVFLPMRQTFTSRQNMGEMQNNQRLTMAFIDIAVRNAGTLNDPTQANKSASDLFKADSSFQMTDKTVVSFTAGQSLVGAGANGNADGVSVRFQSEASSANQGCSAQLAASHIYVDTFTVSGGFLVCTEQDLTAGSAAQSVNLIGNVQGMNILYGVDPKGTGSVTQYMTGDAVTTTKNWSSVKTVQVTLLFTNPLANQAGQTASTISLTKTSPYMANL